MPETRYVLFDRDRSFEISWARETITQRPRCGNALTVFPVVLLGSSLTLGPSPNLLRPYP
jgi:hypothetical protein